MSSRFAARGPDERPFPAFEPFPGLTGGHVQTVAARYLPNRRLSLPSVYFEIELDDGDRLSVLDAKAPGWKAGDPVALLVHGLAGCARSPYVTRVADRLRRRGVRTFRMNLRGAGSGRDGARRMYHAGKTEDVRAVMVEAARRCPGSALAMVGFSLGANLVLKLASEAAEDPVPGLDSVVAANPPLDLAACCDYLRRPGARLYDRNFVTLLKVEMKRIAAGDPDLPAFDTDRIRTLFDFDDVVTAPWNGFRDALHYYESSSAGPLLDRIETPGLVIHAEDDPFIPVESFRNARFPDCLELDLSVRGGHLGYLDRRRFGVDRRWLDARIEDWLVRRWSPLDRPGDARPAAEPSAFAET